MALLSRTAGNEPFEIQTRNHRQKLARRDSASHLRVKPAKEWRENSRVVIHLQRAENNNVLDQEEHRVMVPAIAQQDGRHTDEHSRRKKEQHMEKGGGGVRRANRHTPRVLRATTTDDGQDRNAMTMHPVASCPFSLCLPSCSPIAVCDISGTGHNSTLVSNRLLVGLFSPARGRPTPSPEKILEKHYSTSLLIIQT